MGTDIHGWIETRDLDDEKWIAITPLFFPLDNRNYDIFGSLFGVRNLAGFRPIASARGLPEDCSDEVRQDFEKANAAFPAEFFGATWITWSEIKAIDGEEQGSARILNKYHKDSNGDLLFVGVSRYERGNPHTLEQSGVSEQDLLAERVDWGQEGQIWQFGDVVYKVDHIRRKDVLFEDECWDFVFKLIDLIARNYAEIRDYDIRSHKDTRESGGERTRLVVWFDG